MWAAYRQDWTSIIILLKYGAEANHLDSQGRDALQIVFFRYSDPGHLRDAVAIKALAAKICNVNRSTPYGTTALKTAAASNSDPITIQILLDAGATFNETGVKATSAVHYAAAYGGIVSLSALCAAGADPNESNDFGTTPLMFAVMMNRHETARWLLHSKKVAISAVSSKEQWGLLHFVAKFADLDTLRILHASITAAGLQTLDVTRRDAKGLTPMEAFEQRRSLPGRPGEKLQFNALLN